MEYIQYDQPVCMRYTTASRKQDIAYRLDVNIVFITHIPSILIFVFILQPLAVICFDANKLSVSNWQHFQLELWL